uniref:Cyclin N-terminal domain-containing protein n=1 Tax=Arcella intermedia TaxID=1963864 RepID=A0A6B2LHJ2_9EUKA
MEVQLAVAMQVQRSCSSNPKAKNSIVNPSKTHILENLSKKMEKCVRVYDAERDPFPSIYDERAHPVHPSPSRPSIGQISSFLRKIDLNQYPAEVYVTANIYVDRMVSFSGVSLHEHNWRRILLAAVVVSSKYYMDDTIHSGDFLDSFPDLTLGDLHNLEREFLSHLDYHLFVQVLPLPLVISDRFSARSTPATAFV